ncbi:DUF6916 family protein [Flavobacterium sp. CF136]|jgi:hypothetical protein|uniref:DUF6916 family protein n=1 Tax=Flavobacterium sp. (strain CF136) TaxID=1144313 RepID=UPI0002715B26|nr:hypothetical protein [Flavobacterium sp. CF136]EJL62937.1 hypothetical protein PMI10_02563 [Flavobacterium sp. CF136]
MDIALLTLNDFDTLINNVFTIRISDEVQLEAELIELTKLNNYSPLERNPFSIVFRTEQKNEYYEQGIFIVVHPEKGDLQLFLSPLGFDDVGMKYEAVFS